jgi:hypothetical protein
MQIWQKKNLLMLQIIVVQVEVLQMRFHFGKAGWVRGICSYVAGVMIDFCGFEYEFWYYKWTGNATEFIFYWESQYFNILNSDML